MDVITGDKIEMFRLKCLYKALEFHGMGLSLTRVNPIKVAKADGYQGRTAKDIMADMKAKHPWI